MYKNLKLVLDYSYYKQIKIIDVSRILLYGSNKTLLTSLKLCNKKYTIIENDFQCFKKLFMSCFYLLFFLYVIIVWN